MSYRNKTYVAFDGDNDMWAYRIMQAWHEHDHIDFNFYNAHDINSARDTSSEESIKAQLRERMANAKLMVQKLCIRKFRFMSLAGYKRTVFSWKTLKQLVSSFFQVFGVIALILGVLDILFPNTFNFGYRGIVVFSCVSLLLAIIYIII